MLGFILLVSLFLNPFMKSVTFRDSLRSCVFNDCRIVVIVMMMSVIINHCEAIASRPGHCHIHHHRLASVAIIIIIIVSIVIIIVTFTFHNDQTLGSIIVSTKNAMSRNLSEKPSPSLNDSPSSYLYFPTKTFVVACHRSPLVVNHSIHFS